MRPSAQPVVEGRELDAAMLAYAWDPCDTSSDASAAQAQVREDGPVHTGVQTTQSLTSRSNGGLPPREVVYVVPV